MPEEEVNEEKKEDESVYNEEGREGLSDDDEISPGEQGFMKGYDEADDEEKDKTEDDKEEE